MTRERFDVERLFSETMRHTAVREAIDRLEWQYRASTYQLRCEDGTCHSDNVDPTQAYVEVRDLLLEVFSLKENPLAEAVEAITALLRKNVEETEVKPPDHLWVARDDTGWSCVCGESGYESTKEDAEQAWQVHAGDSGLTIPAWQEAWLEAQERNK